MAAYMQKLLGISILAVFMLLVARPSPALACSYATGSMKEYVKNADIIAQGRIHSVKDAASQNAFRAELSVEKYYKGSDTANLEVWSGRLCGLSPLSLDSERERYVLFLYERMGGGYSVGFLGSFALSDDKADIRLAELSSITGPGFVPGGNRDLTVTYCGVICYRAALIGLPLLAVLAVSVIAYLLVRRRSTRLRTILTSSEPGA